MRILTVILCAAALAGCTTGYNYFEDDTSDTVQPPTTAFGMVLQGAGIVAPRKAPIEYTTRAPLALPPGRELPPPEPSVAATTAVDWPDDPDEAEKRRVAASIAAGESTAAYEGSMAERADARLTAEEIQSGRLAGGGLDNRTDPLSAASDPVRRLSPVELAKTFMNRNSGTDILDESGQVKPRRYLVEPPDEYRTPSADAPLPDPDDVEQSAWAKDRLYEHVKAPNGRNNPARQ